jgi:hypothetical protein
MRMVGLGTGRKMFRPYGMGHAVVFPHPIHLKILLYHGSRQGAMRIFGLRTGRKMFRPYGMGPCGVFFIRFLV